ncbi:hypothetical protein FisN_4Lh273 [Fistulifera solaris]|uniref:DUF6824 domain-containing protein n=1 Tax=Fistulifera solaris TaxID=1519565 RepID=A0A1Z5KD16_FISSO|nr:hypothetical protein FisN_4Lh273 [Fistulifera solaris]|eukprot:GAX24184.1 hypothetical protein FisN_4Lh273 [Fistulifera solaris]
MIVKGARHMEGIEDVKARSKKDIDTEPFEQPALNDVLCGKDKTYGIHPGNQRFREMIESFVEVYKGNHSKQDKMKITRTIVAVMKQRYNTRFIKRVKWNGNDMWEQISDAIARDKVSHALRFAANMKRGHRQPVSNKKLEDHCRENEDPLKHTFQSFRGSLLQGYETAYKNCYPNHFDFTHPHFTDFQQCLRRDALLGGMGLSQQFDAQCLPEEPLFRLKFQRSTSNESRDGHLLDIEPTPLIDPNRQSFVLQQQSSLGNIEALLNSMRSEDFQLLLQDDIEKEWV